MVKINNTMRLFALSFVPFIMVLGNSMLIPVLTDIGRELQISKEEASLLITYFSFSAALFIPFLGFISDRIGRKKVIIPALIVYGIGGVVSGVASIVHKEPYEMILWGRVIQGLGAAGTSPIAMALVSDMFSSTERSKALGVIESANGVGKVISPILGSLVAMIAWYLIFFTYSFLTIPIAVIIWFAIKDTHAPGEHKDLKIYFYEIWMILRKKGMGLGICFLAGFFSLFILYGLLANISDILGPEFSDTLLKKGFIVALPVLTMSIISYWAGVYLQNHSQLYKKLLMIGYILCGVSLLLFLVLTTGFYRFLMMEIIGISIGIILTALNTLITSCAPPGKRGVITAVYNSLRFLGIAFGPIYFSDLLIHPLKIYFLSAGIGMLIFLVMRYVTTESLLEYFGTKKNI